MPNSFEAYRELLPLALSWLLSVEEATLTQGRSLSPVELQDAQVVGVQQPEKIRILSVESIAQPENPLLLQAMTEIGMPLEGVAGRATGYGVEVVYGTESRALLRHEFRHVYQFEQAGSMANFVENYVKSVLADGYQNSEFERDARSFEVIIDAADDDKPKPLNE